MNAELNGEARGGDDVQRVQPLTRVAPSVMRFAKPTPRLAGAYDSFDPRCEKIRALRTELLLRREPGDRAEVIALLSPGTGDGRSQLAAELAIAFAQLDRPTLLVDADLRQPSQHLLFAADNKSGLSQAIEHGSTPYFHPVEGLRHLSLLTAGPTPDNALELLLNKRFAALIEEWRESFDFVVLDTAPITQYSDGLAVASLVKRVLVFVRRSWAPLSIIFERTVSSGGRHVGCRKGLLGKRRSALPDSGGHGLDIDRAVDRPGRVQLRDSARWPSAGNRRASESCALARAAAGCEYRHRLARVAFLAIAALTESVSIAVCGAGRR
jgi:protein-tyrosine kinase